MSAARTLGGTPRVAIAIAAVTWTVFAIYHGVLSHPISVIVHGVAGTACFVILGIAALAPGTATWSLHVAAGVGIVGLVLASWLYAPPFAAPPTWFLPAYPLVMALGTSTRSLYAWSVVAAAAIGVIRFARPPGFPIEYAATELDHLSSISALTIVMLGCVAFARRESDSQVVSIERRERTIAQKNVELDELRAATAREMRERMQFVATVSHEVRGPIAAIRGLVSALTATRMNREQQELATTLKRSAEALTQVVNDILDYARIDAGRLSMVAEAYDPREVVEDVVDLWSPITHERGVELIGVVDPRVPDEVIGDAGRVRQILTNLVGNAVKFTKTGSITVRVGPAEGRDRRMVLAVADTGPGIAPDQLSRIFAPFVQGSSEVRTRHGGSGLGLAIVRHLAEAMGGNAGATSELGRGSVFSVELPSEPAVESARSSEMRSCVGTTLLYLDEGPIAREAVLAMANHLGMDAVAASPDGPFDRAIAPQIVIVGSTDAATAERALAAVAAEFPRALRVVALPAGAGALTSGRAELSTIRPLRRARLAALAEDAREGAPEAASTARPIRAVAIDDDPILRSLVVRTLERAGLDARAFADGATGVAHIDREGADLVFLDLHMPGEDGVEVAARIRRTIPSERQPVLVMLTASNDAEALAKVTDAGIPLVLAKPLDAPQLARAVDLVRAGWRRASRRSVRMTRPGGAEGDRTRAGGAEGDRTRAGGAPPLGAAAIDEKKLEELDQLFGEEARSLITDWSTHVDGMMTELRAAISAGDREKAHRVVHTLGSGSGAVGAMALLKEAREMERAFLRALDPEAAARVDSLAAHVAAARSALFRRYAIEPGA